MSKVKVFCGVVILLTALSVFVSGFQTAASLPNQIADDAFWKLIESFSERGGQFQSENFLSNEAGFQAVIPALEQTTETGGVYMGVGPEQNFTYIAAIQPKIAFIIDIRRQNMLQHMLYKAIFEMSTDRAEFLSRLFSRKPPSGLSEKSSVDELFSAFDRESHDEAAFTRNLEEIKALLLTKHRFSLSVEDQNAIEHVYRVFYDYGPRINYNSRPDRQLGGPAGTPDYMELMTAADPQGEKRSYLASEENYRFVQDLERRNLIVPLTGDFGGAKTIRAVGDYLKAHSATLTAFYLSNVEQYLFQGNGNENGGWEIFYANVAMLPLDQSSTFIRSIGGGAGRLFRVGRAGQGLRTPNVLASIQDTLAAVKTGRVQTYYDVLSLSN